LELDPATVPTSLELAEGLTAGSEENCWTVPGAHIERRHGVPYLIYVNNPAFEDLSSGVAHPEFCFEVVLRGLLALGLHPASQKPTTDVDSDLPSQAVTNPKFRAEMIKQGLKVEKDDESGKFKAEKEASETVFSLYPDATAAIRIHHDFRAIVLRCDEFLANDIKSSDSACPVPQPSVETPPQKQKRERANARLKAKYEASILKDKLSNATVDIADLKITVSVRSFESTIYYLGEAVRSQGGKPMTGSAAAASYYLAVVGRQPWGDSDSRYEESLFDLRRGGDASGASLQVTGDNGEHYGVAGYCADVSKSRVGARNAAANCSVEYPNNESLLVLTVVNQLWGLQKEPSADQPIKTINVGSP
jgi:hypothetical protein